MAQNVPLLYIRLPKHKFWRGALLSIRSGCYSNAVVCVWIATLFCVCVWPSVIFLGTPSKQEADSLHKLWQWPTCCRDSFTLEMDPSNSMPRSKRTDATLSTMADQMKNVILSSQQQVWKNERQPLALCFFLFSFLLIAIDEPEKVLYTWKVESSQTRWDEDEIDLSWWKSKWVTATLSLAPPGWPKRKAKKRGNWLKLTDDSPKKSDLCARITAAL